MERSKRNTSLFLCVQGVYYNIRVGIDDDGTVAVVDHHAGLAGGDLLHLFDGGGIYGDVLSGGGFGIVGRQLSGLGHGVVRGCGAAAGDDHMGAVDLGGMEPKVIFSRQFKGQFIILAVVTPHINGVAVGGFKAHGSKLALLDSFFAAIGFDIAKNLYNHVNRNLTLESLEIFDITDGGKPSALAESLTMKAGEKRQLVAVSVPTSVNNLDITVEGNLELSGIFYVTATAKGTGKIVIKQGSKVVKIINVTIN